MRAIFPRVGLGITGQPGNAVIYNCSARGKNQPLPTICRPDLAYRQLFGSVSTGEARTDFQLSGQTIDFLAQDIRRIERQLAGPERDKFAAHVNALESLTASRKSIEGRADVLRRHAPAARDKFFSETAACNFFTSWYLRAMDTGIRVVQEFARTLMAHVLGIYAWYDHPISTGPLEGTNNKIKTMRRQSYGFRDPEFFRLKILGIHETTYALVG